MIKTFGEERFGKRIARAIVERNRIEPMTRTKELAESGHGGNTGEG
ncbi:Ribosomal RNA small subunit methyltransferase H [Raoultella terrigena]|uniref:Ribosomal RNA small subunit methyltransferase H n=1 Tax=Raoultella terrigena TaxID=577 RepID=A0A4U9D8L6_RAOTE|nr:Ribosomal RNA small subunit methyltransferase H [Raoultella terrigena]